jgi:exopolysaccharide production protein ExoZ
MKKQLNSLQLYRGIASVLVVLHHANIIIDRELRQDGSFNIFHFGWIGVDFFFVLSGFIIFYIHQSELGQPSRFGSFISKRFLRIYPLYWIILLTKLSVSLFGDKNIIAHQSNLTEFIQAFLLVPQERANLDNFIGVSWTLTYEVFFYLIFGMLILLKPNIGRSIIIIWIVGLLLNLFNLLPVHGSFLLDFIFSVRNLEFIFGCIAAYTILKYQFRHGAVLAYSALGMLTLSILNTEYHGSNVSGISPAIAYGIPFSILIIGTVWVEKNTSLKIPSILLYLGNASYSIYLTHGFFINNLTRIYVKVVEKLDKDLLLLPPNNIFYIGATSLIVVISISIGCIVYNWIEKPLIDKFRKIILAYTI